MHRSRKSIASSLMVEALLLLLEKEEYDFISVKDICEKAGVNRSTFYTYYNTKDDLLVDTMKLISKRLLSNFDYDTITLKVDIENNFQLIGEIYLVPCLNTIKELRKVYKMLQYKPHIFKKSNINKELYNILHNKLLSKYDIENDEEEFAFAYFNYGVLAIIDKWVESNCEEDVSKIANLIIKMLGFYD